MHKFFFYNKFTICLYMFRVLCAHHQEVKTVLYSIWYHDTCRWPSGVQVERGLRSLLYASTCFEHCVLIIMRSKLYYTVSGIMTPVGGRPVCRSREDCEVYYMPLKVSSTMCSSSCVQNCIIQHLVSSHL